MNVDTPAMQERESAFSAALKGDGLRMTHQRLEVIRELAASRTHPDADELFRAVRERVPTISRDTVYRTLATLVSHGLVERIPAPGSTRFDPDVSGHSHFTCTRCGEIIDLSPMVVGDHQLPSKLEGVADVTSVRLEIKGVCLGCDPPEPSGGYR